MRYMLLIHTNGPAEPKPGTPEFDARGAAYMSCTQKMIDDGKFIAGDGLHDIDTAKIVRKKNGESLVTAGPFAETAEQIGGFYILECADIDEAAKYAANIPVSEPGGVEIRPLLMVM